MSSGNEWGQGEWWEEVPPPPGQSDDGEDWENFEDEFDPDDIPPDPATASDDENWEWGGSLTEEVFNAYDLIERIENVDPANIRGTAFSTPEEAFEWLRDTGLLAISKIVEQGGSYYPVVGEYDDDDPEQPAEQPPDDVDGVIAVFI